MKTKEQLKKEQLQKEIKEYVQNWIDGHEPDTFIKNEHGVYLYSSGAVSLNLKLFFEMLLEDFVEDKLTEKENKF